MYGKQFMNYLKAEKSWRNPGCRGRSINSAYRRSRSSREMGAEEPRSEFDWLIPTYRWATELDFQPAKAMSASKAVPARFWLTAPPTLKECMVYLRPSSSPASRMLAWRDAVI